MWRGSEGIYPLQDSDYVYLDYFAFPTLYFSFNSKQTEIDPISLLQQNSFERTSDTVFVYFSSLWRANIFKPNIFLSGETLKATVIETTLHIITFGFPRLLVSFFSFFFLTSSSC